MVRHDFLFVNPVHLLVLRVPEGNGFQICSVTSAEVEVVAERLSRALKCHEWVINFVILLWVVDKLSQVQPKAASLQKLGFWN